MPRQTFFNLSKEKQTNILQAAKREFTRVPLSEASIANIIRDAKIPRGSFYQYFDDKEDLFYYLLNEHAKMKHEAFITHLQNNNGDIFLAMLSILKEALENFNHTAELKFYKNIFLHLNYKTEKALVNHLTDHGFHQRFSHARQYMNIEALHVKNDEELVYIVQILFTLMMQSFVLKFAKKLSKDEVIKHFEKQIHLLKRGFMKKDEIKENVYEY